MVAPNELDDKAIHDATRDVIDRVIRFDDETRRRIFRTALTFYGLDMPSGAHPAAFSNRAERSAKDFLIQKQPKTDVERVACLAYYLSHYRDTPQFKTLDISKLNTEAAQTKFSNAAYAVAKAVNAGLLVPVRDGLKQLSAMGERYMDALPDRVAARAVLATFRTRRGRKTGKNGRESATSVN